MRLPDAVVGAELNDPSEGDAPMQSDEYQRLSAACQAMAAQSSNHLADRVRWSKLAERSSNLADEVAAPGIEGRREPTGASQ
jgi:hypothetical protein